MKSLKTFKITFKFLMIPKTFSKFDSYQNNFLSLHYQTKHSKLYAEKRNYYTDFRER